MQSSILNIQIIRTTDEFSLLEDTWNTLLDKSGGNRIFLRWEWLYSWWQTYREDNYNLALILVFKDDTIIGIAPFYVAHFSRMGVIPVRRLLFLGTKEGHVISEFMDIIYSPGDENTVISAVFDVLVKEDICDDFCFHKIETSSKTISVLRQLSCNTKLFFTVQEEYESPYIRLPETMDDFLDSLSSSLRHKIRNNRRKLGKYPQAVFRKTVDSAALEKDFDELVRLHQIRWESRNFSGSFADRSFSLFQKTVMPLLLNNGNLELWFLSISDKNIGVLYNIRYNNNIYFFQGGLDTSFDDSLTPGYLLHSYCIEHAIQQGLSEYHFLLMGHLDDYKKRWARNSLRMCDIYMARPGIMELLMKTKDKAKTCYHSLRKYYAGPNA